MTNFRKKLFVVNFDGARGNLGRRRGVATLLKNDLPWMLVVHRFNHRLELSIKGVVMGTRFQDIDDMLTQMYYLYQNRSLRGLKELGDELGKYTPPPPPKTHEGHRDAVDYAQV